MTRPLRSDEAEARRLPLLLGDRARFAQRAQLLALIARQTVALTALILDCLDEVRSDSYDTPSYPAISRIRPPAQTEQCEHHANETAGYGLR
jgi:hypothetical protein